MYKQSNILLKKKLILSILKLYKLLELWYQIQKENSLNELSIAISKSTVITENNLGIQNENIIYKIEALALVFLCSPYIEIR